MFDLVEGAEFSSLNAAVIVRCYRPSFRNDAGPAKHIGQQRAQAPLSHYLPVTRSPPPSLTGHAADGRGRFISLQMRAFNTASASALLALACTAAVVVPPPGHQHNNSIVIGSQASPAQPAKDLAASVGLPAVTKPMKEPPASAGRLPRRGRQLSCTCVDVPGFPCYTTHNDHLSCWSFTDKESCESTGGEYCGSTSITSEVCGMPFRSSGDMILNMLLPVQLVAKCWNNWPLVIIELMTLALEIAILVDLVRCVTKCTLCCGDYADWVRDDPAAATTTVVTAFGIGIGLAEKGVGALGTTARPVSLPIRAYRSTCQPPESGRLTLA